MKVVKILDPESPIVKVFYAKCQARGFSNNVSARAIKYDWAVHERQGMFWGVLKDGEMIGMSGCHWMPEINDSAFRILFRGCELPGTDEKKTLSRSQFNSFNFREVVPHQLQWIRELGKHYQTYLTTNHSNRNHRAMELIAKQGFLTKHAEGIYFGVMQTVWKFNEFHYETVKTKIKSYAV